MKIDKNTPTPFYRQLTLILQDKIVIGEWVPGMLLPTEFELCDQYNVSRVTVRRALEDLASKGLIDRVQGKGSLVKKVNDTNATSDHRGFSQTIRDQGYEPQANLLKEELVKGNAELVQLFELPEDDEHYFWCFTRLRLFNDEPAAITRTYVQKKLGDRMREFDLSKESFYSLYKNITKRNIVRNDGLIKAISVSDYEAELLQVKSGSAHLWYRGVAYVAGNVPIEVNYTIYHGEKFSFFKPETYSGEDDVVINSGSLS